VSEIGRREAAEVEQRRAEERDTEAERPEHGAVGHRCVPVLHQQLPVPAAAFAAAAVVVAGRRRRHRPRLDVAHRREVARRLRSAARKLVSGKFLAAGSRRRPALRRRYRLHRNPLCRCSQLLLTTLFGLSTRYVRMIFCHYTIVSASTTVPPVLPKSHSILHFRRLAVLYI